MLAFLGMAASFGLALLAFVRSRSAGGFYDDAVYGMTPRTHLRYALAAALLGLAFGVMLVVHANGLTIAALAALTLLAVFYLTSFLRGFSDDQD